MADWSTIASFATAGGTLALAAATFSAVRSSNQSARVAERSLLAGLRPVLVPSRREDPTEKVVFVDLKWLHVAGGQATLDAADGEILMAMGIRNVGTGLAVLRGWRVQPGFVRTADSSDPRPSTRSGGRPAISTFPPATRASGKGRSANQTTPTGTTSWPRSRTVRV